MSRSGGAGFGQFSLVGAGSGGLVRWLGVRDGGGKACADRCAGDAGSAARPSGRKGGALMVAGVRQRRRRSASVPGRVWLACQLADTFIYGRPRRSSTLLIREGPAGLALLARMYVYEQMHIGRRCSGCTTLPIDPRLRLQLRCLGLPVPARRSGRRLGSGGSGWLCGPRRSPGALAC